MAKIIYKTYCPNCRLGYSIWELPFTESKVEIRIGDIWNLPIIDKVSRACTACGFIFEGKIGIVMDVNLHSNNYGEQIFIKIMQPEFNL